jgi:hypothetical protein
MSQFRVAKMSTMVDVVFGVVRAHKRNRGIALVAATVDDPCVAADSRRSRSHDSSLSSTNGAGVTCAKSCEIAPNT